MARKTFGENMSSFEAGDDARYFQKRFEKALERKDYPRLRELVDEGRRYDYPMPSVAGDVNAMEIKADAFMDSFRQAETRKKYSEIVKLIFEAKRVGYPIPAPKTSIVMSLVTGILLNKEP